MSRTLRRIALVAAATAGLAGAAPAEAAAQTPEPCYIHGGSQPYLACMVENAIWRVEQIIPIW